MGVNRCVAGREARVKRRGHAGCARRRQIEPLEGSKIMVSVGLFEGTLPRNVIKNVWLEHKPAWYEAPRVGPITSEAFVALALAQPIESPTAQYGYAMHAGSASKEPPGVIALTWIPAQDPSERERIRAHSRENVTDFMSEPGFISIVTGFTGLRGFTVTAWEAEASMKRALGKHMQSR